jgi:integrase/recombinase XerD
MLERFQRHLFYYRKKDGQPLCISSQAHWLTALRGWFTWMKDEKILTQNPTVEMKLPKEEKRLPRHPLSEEEVEAILAQPNLRTATGLRSRALMEVLYSTGMRRFEALNLYASDIDRERGVVLVRNGKGKKDRFTPIGERALAWIDRYVTEGRPKLTQDPSQPLLFVTKDGRPMEPNSFTTTVNHYMRKAGVHKAGSCHLFRHTAVTLMLDRGADIRHLQEILGHKSLQTTQVYTHVSIG